MNNNSYENKLVEVSERIKELRDIYNLSDAEMAEKTGELISFDNYKLQSELVFVPTEPEIDEFEYENALKTVKEKFPELIFDKD